MSSADPYAGIHLDPMEKFRAATILQWLLAESNTEEYVSEQGYRLIKFSRREAISQSQPTEEDAA